MSSRSKAYTAITNEGELELFSIGDIEFYKVTNNSSEQLIALMNHFCFMKSLFNMTKEQEVESLTAMGYNEIVKYTWFCHNPVLGMPCGHCNPCKDAINEGMSWRVPLTGRVLGTLRIPVSFTKRALKKCLSLRSKSK